MKFIDKITIKVKAGKGGDGAVAFRRELYVPKGGPAGGDGGNGGNIIFIGDEGINTLLELNYQKEIKGVDGENGQHKNMHGKNTKNTYISVPLGTIIYDGLNKEEIGDVVTNKQEVIVANGGRGGKGNSRFANSRNRAPTIFTRGDLGDEKEITCELKLLADVGIVGMPNAGKSTLLGTISHAKPQIGDFPFTTLTPQLGVVKHQNFSFVVADLPGLIAGASLGKGLGYEFLKHIERCQLLVHLIDISLPNAYDNYSVIQKELKDYNLQLENKQQIVVASKMDQIDASRNLELFSKQIKQKVYSISAWTREGIESLVHIIHRQLQTIKKIPELKQEMAPTIYGFTPTNEEVIVENLGNGHWKVIGASVHRIYHKFPLTTHDNLLLFNQKLRDLGVFKILVKKGIQKGDTIKIFDYELQWLDENF
ncbi:GTPase ObgE [Spiroplasma endosymbiont of 'Nebria riversi']|uniref:GTPase ObgE n=1 Tax=Spiroplasma endosymbiont of 'Nebria riversi' TaxID=2792084 RepID=UPI001C0556FA|nr:GTPase ObgE [Spiroplasma endosymbiont of 'Nebria riversi']